MPKVKDQGICLRRWEWSESSQIVLILSPDYGLLRGVAKGALRPGSKFSGGIDILTKGRFSAVIKPDRDLQTLTEWEMCQIWRKPREIFKINKDATLVIDLLSRLLIEGEPATELFENTITYLDNLEKGNSRLHALMIWLLSLCKISGFEPTFHLDVKSREKFIPSGKIVAFSPTLGGVTTSADKTTWAVRDETIGLLMSFSQGGAPANVPEKSLERACALLIAWIRQIIQFESEAIRFAFPNLPQDN